VRKGEPVKQCDGELDNCLGLRAKGTEAERLHSHAKALGGGTSNLGLLRAASLNELISDMLASLSFNEQQCKFLSIGFALGLAERLVDGLAHHRRCQRKQHKASSTDRTAFGAHPTTEARQGQKLTHLPPA